MKTEDLGDIAAELRTQDNAITADPIFTVQQKERIYRVDSDDFTWLETDDYNEIEPAEAEVLERVYRRTGTEPDGCERVGYVDRWVFVQPFFTRKGAEHYIKINGHNLKSPRIYVESAFRNTEWQRVRAALKEKGAI